MGQRDRTLRYKVHGAGADLIRVEVLVPAGQREKLLSIASGLRESHRGFKKKVEPLIQKAIARYGVKLTDNVDLEKLSDYQEKARVVARVLQDRTDANGFVLARQLLDAAEDCT